MRRMTVRARLTLWHSGLLALLVLGFAVASQAFLRRTELRRLDSTLREQSEIVMQAMRSAGVTAARASLDTAPLLDVLHDLRSRGTRAWVFDAKNRAVLSTSMVHEGEGSAEERRVLGDTVPAEALRRASMADRAEGATFTARTDSERARLFGARLPADLGAGSIVVSASLRDLDELLDESRQAAMVAVVVAFVLSGVAGYALARRSLRPVTDMSHQADRIDAERLHERLPVANPHDELGVLATTFNKLLDRVGLAFEQQRRFMADASHELRTPVAIMRGEADVALAEDRPRETYRDALVVIRDAAGRLTRTVNDIFLLARVDAKQVPTTAVPLYFDELVAETCRAMRSLAGQRNITLRCDTTSGEVPYVGDEPLLERLVMNLLDNAIKYSDDGGTVSVCLSKKAGEIVLTVANGGRGIPPAARPHVFDRFFRADEARTHGTVLHGSGSGLGLSIARWIAELHAGRLELTEASASTTVFTVTLPLEPALRAAR